MRADGTIVKIAKSGPPPEIELVFGNAQWGKYEVDLWDAVGHNPTVVRKGLNNDQIPDKFPVSVSSVELDRCLLAWDATFGALGAKGQQYSLRVVLTQDGKPLTATPFEYSGPLNGNAKIADYVKFRTV